MSSSLHDACEAEERFDLDDLEGYAFIECPACMGRANRFDYHTLGKSKWFNCRHCGAWFSEGDTR